MVREYYVVQTVKHIKATSYWTKRMDMASLPGLTANPSKVNGNKTI